MKISSEVLPRKPARFKPQSIGFFPRNFIRFFITIPLLILFVSCHTPVAKKERIRQAVSAELKRYPEARLVDLYKFFFQGAFGPGHLINDRSAALRFLHLELKNSAEFDSVIWQPVGYEEKFYRLNLGLVKKGRIPKEAYFDAFVASANAVKEPSREDWQREWRFILAIIEEVQLEIDGFAQDKSMLEARLVSGDFVLHHSEHFRKTYHPHYRLVDKKHFDELTRKYLKK